MVHSSLAASQHHHDDSMATLDEYVAPGLRLWMLIGLVSGVLMIMIIIVCCFMRIRIPRTKREIELITAQRKMRKAQAVAAQNPMSSGGGSTVGGSGINNMMMPINGLQRDDERFHGCGGSGNGGHQTFVLNSLSSSTSKNHHHHHQGSVKREPLPSRSANV